MWLKKADIAEKLGKTPRQIDHLVKKGDITSNGKKYGKVRFWYEGDDIDPDQIDSGETLEEAKKRKIIAEANLAELKHPREIERIQREFAADVILDVIEAMSGLNNVYRNMGLTSEQNEQIREHWQQSMKKLESKLAEVKVGD